MKIKNYIKKLKRVGFLFSESEQTRIIDLFVNGLISIVFISLTVVISMIYNKEYFRESMQNSDSDDLDKIIRHIKTSVVIYKERLNVKHYSRYYGDKKAKMSKLIDLMFLQRCVNLSKYAADKNQVDEAFGQSIFQYAGAFYLNKRNFI